MYFYMKVKWIVNPSKQNKQASPPNSPDKLGNFFLSQKWANYLIASHPVHMEKIWHWGYFAASFLFYLLFSFLNRKMSWFLWAAEAKTLKKMGELFCLKLIYFTNVHSYLFMHRVVPAAAVFEVTCILLRKLHWYNSYLRKNTLVYLETRSLWNLDQSFVVTVETFKHLNLTL